MNRDDIIKMATEVWETPKWTEVQISRLERFFHMAQAHALANIDPSKFMSYQEGFEAGQFAEREACHALRQSLPNPHEHCQVSAHAYDMAIVAYGKAIRARGTPQQS